MLISTREAANILRVNTSRVRQLIAAKRIKARKVGGAWVIQSKALERMTVRKVGRPRRES